MHRMTRTVGTWVWAGLWCMLVGVGQAWAASGDAVQYTITITTLEMSTDNGATYQTVFSGSTAIDIASVSAGAAAAGLVSAADLPAGTYNAIRATVSPTLLVKGYVNIGGSTLYTDGAGTLFTQNTGVEDTPGTDYAASTFTIGGGNLQKETTGFNIKVGRGSAPVCNVAFDVSGVINNGPGIDPPTVNITVQ